MSDADRAGEFYAQANRTAQGTVARLVEENRELRAAAARVVAEGRRVFARIDGGDMVDLEALRAAISELAA